MQTLELSPIKGLKHHLSLTNTATYSEKTGLVSSVRGPSSLLQTDVTIYGGMRGGFFHCLMQLSHPKTLQKGSVDGGGVTLVLLIRRSSGYYNFSIASPLPQRHT